MLMGITRGEKGWIKEVLVIKNYMSQRCIFGLEEISKCILCGYHCSL